jgi:hypothetical protein
MRCSWALVKQGIGQTGHWALEEYLTFLRTAIIRTENWLFSKTLIAYLLASEAATIILASRILVGVYNSKKIEVTVGCPGFPCL